jgi:hypothetical protein
LYMEATKKIPFSFRFQRNSSCLFCSWMFAKHWSKAFQATSLCPDRSLLNAAASGEVSITLAIVSPLWCTMLYKVGYCSQREAFPSHLSSQNCIFEPPLMEKRS